jgi:hypothetical protein
MAQLRANGSSEVPPALTDAAADAGIGAEQRDRAELPLGLLDHVQHVLFLRDVAFEGRAIDGAGHVARGVHVKIGDDDLGSTGAMKSLAQRLADPVAATGDNHHFAGHLHRAHSRQERRQLRTMSSTAV